MAKRIAFNHTHFNILLVPFKHIWVKAPLSFSLTICKNGLKQPNIIFHGTLIIVQKTICEHVCLFNHLKLSILTIQLSTVMINIQFAFSNGKSRSQLDSFEWLISCSSRSGPLNSSKFSKPNDKTFRDTWKSAEKGQFLPVILKRSPQLWII